MELGIDALLKGKPTRIKDRCYLDTESYVDPFLERMSQLTEDFIIQVKMPDQISMTRDADINQDDLIYNRVWIQAILPDELDGHKEVIGMVYGLDVKEPVLKIYRGGLNTACLNLCIFSPTSLSVQGIEPDTPFNFKPIDDLLEEEMHWRDRIKSFKEAVVPWENLNERLGMWVRNTLHNSYNSGFGKVSLSTNNAINAYKLLYEKNNSPYYVQENQPTTLFNIYNAWTQTITDDTRDIINKAEKTLLLTHILGIA